MADRRREERGSMAVEVVLLTPVLVMFTLLVVAGGRFVTVQGDIEAAARDAVRAASYQRDARSAGIAAAAVVEQSLDGTDCSTRLDRPFTAGSVITVHLACSVSLSGLGLLGLPGSVSMDAESSAPLDTYRRTG